MLEINLICAGVRGMKEDYFRAAENEYLKRISKYAKITITEVGDNDKEIIAAAEKKKKNYTVALCIDGDSCDSQGFAGFLENVGNSGKPGINFIIGGSGGFGKEVKDYADKQLSFSHLTFPHRLMRIILEEQIYRGLNILAGGKYNK